MAEGVVGMAVALYTSEGGAQQGFPGGVDPVQDGSDAKFLIIGASFVIGHGIAMKSRGDVLIFGWMREEIAGDLFGDELIVRLVRVKCPDEPVAVAPDVARVITFIAFGIGITSEVQPHAGPFFTVMG